MLTQIQWIILCALFGVIAVLFLTTVFYKHSSDRYKAETYILNQSIQLQNSKIEEFKSQSEQLNKQLQDTQNIASVTLQNNLKKDNSILTANVPSDCESSMQWLKEQAMEMSK